MRRRRSIAGVAFAFLVLAGCGGSSGSKEQSAIDSIASQAKPNKTKPKPAPSSASTSGGCITSGGYGGLYSTEAAFNSNNPTTQPSQPIPGVAVYRIDS